MKCPNCGEKMLLVYKDDNVEEYWCPYCGMHGYVYCGAKILIGDD